MQNKLHRLLMILQALPYAPRRISTGEIQRCLSAAGHEVSLRSVQRDLEHLSDSFAITSDNARPAGWCWSKDAAVMGVPALDPHSALVLQLAKKYLDRLLPVATMEHLSPQFRQAADTLDAHGNGLRKWQNKVRVIQRGVTLTPPKVDSAIQATIYECLLKEKKIKIQYRPRLDGPKDYEVSPLGLIVRDRVTYLICEVESQLRQFLLHRIVSAEVGDSRCNCPEGFDIDAYIQQGEMGYPAGGKIKLKLAVNQLAARQLIDCPLSADQCVTESEVNDDDVIIEATVQDSMELRWWLLSFGAQAEILQPTEWRTWFKEETAYMASTYV